MSYVYLVVTNNKYGCIVMVHFPISFTSCVDDDDDDDDDE